MIKNVNKIDMTIRIILGIAIAVWGIMESSWWGLLAVIPLATGIINWCPIYAALGISTCKIKSK